jgi:hypothetical protein
MDIKTLIEHLSKYDPNTRVVVQGYESGYDELDTMYTVALTKNEHKQDKWWDGEFNEAAPANGKEVALLLPRKS